MSKSHTVTVTLFPAYILVFIVFLLLKVFHVVDWSWWLVTLPLWWSWALYFGILAVFGLGALLLLCILGLYEKFTNR